MKVFLSMNPEESITQETVETLIGLLKNTHDSVAEEAGKVLKSLARYFAEGSINGDVFDAGIKNMILAQYKEFPSDTHSNPETLQELFDYLLENMNEDMLVKTINIIINDPNIAKGDEKKQFRFFIFLELMRKTARVGEKDIFTPRVMELALNMLLKEITHIVSS